MVGLFISPLWAVGQRIEIGGGLGAMLYKGDVSPVYVPRVARPGGSLFFRYHPSRSFAVRAQIAVGRLTAADSLSNDPIQIARGASFRNTVREAALTAEYKFRNYTPLPHAKNWTPYVFGGVSVFSHSLRVEGDGPVQIGFPLGVGIKYEIARPWSIGLEVGTRFTFTDSLDGLRNPDASTPRISQSNPDRKDQYTFVAITVSYTFYKIVCPPGSQF
jgi:hypothetical protein